MQLPIAAVAGGLVGVATMLAAPKLAGSQSFGVDTDVALLAIIGVLFLLLMMSRPSSKSSAPKLPTDAVSVNLTGDEQKDFLIVFESLTKELLSDIERYKLPARTADYMKRMMEYNVPKGKLTRGLTVISAYKSIKGVKTLSEVEYIRAAVLGWTVEWLQAVFLVWDDIMDASETRRGQVCWYLLPDVKMNAINDGLLLEAQIYVLLKKYFDADKDLYLNLLELMHETTHQTALGQFLDLTTAEPNVVDFSRFSLGVYSDIVIYKTAFYSFYLPCAFGMRLAGVTDASLYAKAKTICMEIGHLFQVQDDYLDCYGDPQRIGKIGTDIRDNKCGWLINTALAKCTPAQRRELEGNYAKGKNDRAEKKVKEIFKALDLETDYRRHEDEAYAKIKAQIDEVEGMPTDIFKFLLKKIYKRDK